MGMLRALVADDHPMCRQAESSVLRAVINDCLVTEVSTVADTVDRAEETDIILLDLGLPDGQGIAGLLAVVGAAPHARVIVVTGNEAPGLDAMVRAAGGSGLVLKSAPMTVLVCAIEAVLNGRQWFPDPEPLVNEDDQALTNVSARIASLSVAERRVLGAMCDGSLNKQIAFRFGLSEVTVKQHVKAVLRKLNVLNRTQAAVLMQFQSQNGQIPL